MRSYTPPSLLQFVLNFNRKNAVFFIFRDNIRSDKESNDTIGQSLSSCIWNSGRTTGTCSLTNPGENYANPVLASPTLELCIFETHPHPFTIEKMTLFIAYLRAACDCRKRYTEMKLYISFGHQFLLQIHAQSIAII